MKKQFAIALTALTLPIFAAVPVSAGTIVYNDFSNATGLTLQGGANLSNIPGVLQITPSTAQTAGVAYLTDPVALGPGGSFSTQFQMRINKVGGVGSADGLTFFVGANTAGLGRTGGTLGYSSGPANSFAVEFDTYFNPATLDVNGNHVAVDTKGFLWNYDATAPYGVTNCTPQVAGCLSDGDIWTVDIDYDGATKFLNVYVEDAAIGSMFHAINNYSLNVPALLGTNLAYVGFTGATGGGFQEQDILNWTFDPPGGPNSIPEPLSLSLFGAGAAGLAMRRRRKAAQA